jgi:hypothetical protein
MFALVVVAALHTTGINLHAGDLSAQLGYVAGDSERDRIRGHLLFAHDLLAAADPSGLSPALRAARAKNLAVLARYARAGQFPRNDDHPDARRPTFVDARGEICAVGALFASDQGYPAAVRVAERHKYAFIVELDDPQLAAWQQTSGLTTEELALIQPAYDGPPVVPDRMWLPWGLSDRSQFGAIRVSLAQEVSTSDSYDSLWMTAHLQTPLPGGSERAFYLTIPAGVVLDDQTSIAAAGMPLGNRPRRWLGNSDIGVYFGDESWTGGTTVFRLGALVPTATEHDPQPPRMRAGDLVMELPRAYGGRFAVSRLSGWRHVVDRTRYAYRLDAGFDYARAADGESTTVVPRAALGALISRPYATLSIDTAVAHAYDTATGDSGLRWSTGTTIRLVDRRARGCGIEPAITVAAVRTSEGWGGALSLELGFGVPTATPD